MKDTITLIISFVGGALLVYVGFELKQVFVLLLLMYLFANIETIGKEK